MLFAVEYGSVLDRLEREYPIPKETKFVERHFYYVRWKKKKSKNFYYIIKTLAEQGPSTIREIAENDGRTKDERAVKTRVDIYNRIINGSKKDHVIGLIEKGVIKKLPKEKKCEPMKYQLSLSGIFYAIHAFSDKSPILHETERLVETKETIYKGRKQYDKTILNSIAKTHETELRFIFGKWDYLIKQVKGLLNKLVFFSHGYFNPFSSNELLYSVWPPRYRFTKSPDSIYAEEITLWFYHYLCTSLGPQRFYEFIKKDDEIHKWYSSHINSLIDANKEDELRLLSIKLILEGDFESAYTHRDEILAFHGIKNENARTS